MIRFFVFNLSKHWVAYKSSSNEKHLSRTVGERDNRIKELLVQVSELAEQFEKEQVSNSVLVHEVEKLTEVLERDRARVYAEMKAFGTRTEETDQSVNSIIE